MFDLIKSGLLIIIYLLIFSSLGVKILCVVKENFSFTFCCLIGFFAYHFLFCLVALPCILTQQTLTTLMWIWLPLLVSLLALCVFSCRKELLSHAALSFDTLKETLLTPRKLILPCIAVVCVLFVLYLSVSSYYVGWDTAFYVRTTLYAVEKDSMYVLDAATGQLASTLSLRYALSPFYMNSAIFSRLLNLHPLLVQNIADGCICILLAFFVIYHLGLLLSGNNPHKAWLTVIFAAVLHLGHSSVFSSSDFLLLRSYEAKAFCANVVLPFAVYNLISLWMAPDKKSNWLFFFLGVSASVVISMSSLFTVPALVLSGSLVWLINRNWRCLRNAILCMIPNMLFLIAYVLETVGVISIPII